MKKTIGTILIAVGLAILVLSLYNYFLKKRRVISPIPENGGVNVIQITPME